MWNYKTRRIIIKIHFIKDSNKKYEFNQFSIIFILKIILNFDFFIKRIIIIIIFYNINIFIMENRDEIDGTNCLEKMFNFLWLKDPYLDLGI